MDRSIFLKVSGRSSICGTFSDWGRRSSTRDFLGFANETDTLHGKSLSYCRSYSYKGWIAGKSNFFMTIASSKCYLFSFRKKKEPQMKVVVVDLITCTMDTYYGKFCAERKVCIVDDLSHKNLVGTGEAGLYFRLHFDFGQQAILRVLMETTADKGSSWEKMTEISYDLVRKKIETQDESVL